MKIRVKILFFCLAVFFVSCIVRYDKLEYYTNDFTPKTSCVKTEGYYLTKVDDMNYQAIFFYNDGSCIYTGYYPSRIVLEDYINNYPNSFSNETWGFYQCIDDKVLMECIQVYDRKAYRIGLKGVFGDNDQLKIIGDDYIIEYDFISSTKPDSTLNWLKTHRKYKLDTLSTLAE